MKTSAMLLAGCLALAFAASSPADPPASREKQKSQKHQSAQSYASAGYFTDVRVGVIRGYYTGNKRAGGCPPGLARKGNGCQPPGQAKKWRIGAPLPADVGYYDLPPALIHELGRPPEGHKIVRVGTDLLLIAIGSQMVVEALDDLGDVF